MVKIASMYVVKYYNLAVSGMYLICYTMKINLPKLLSVLISWIKLLNFSLKNISPTVQKCNCAYFYQRSVNVWIHSNLVNFKEF